GRNRLAVLPPFLAIDFAGGSAARDRRAVVTMQHAVPVPFLAKDIGAALGERGATDDDCGAVLAVKDAIFAPFLTVGCRAAEDGRSIARDKERLVLTIRLESADKMHCTVEHFLE